MLRVKERVGVVPGVELDSYPSGKGVVRIDMDVDSSSGTIRVVPTVVGSCLEPPLVPGDTLPVYHPREIEFEGKRYILKEPLECDVHWDVEGGDYLWVEYAPLELYGAGYTLSEAVEHFSLRFADRYEFYNEIAIPDNRYGYHLDARLEGIRRGLNELVLSTIEVI
jgi:hypothetical protein